MEWLRAARGTAERTAPAGFELAVGAAAPWLLAAYLLVPPLFKASLQPFFPVDLTVLLAIPTTAVGCGWLLVRRGRLERGARVALVLWLGLAGLVAAGTVWAPDSAIALRSAAYFIGLASIPLLAAFPVASNERRVRQFLLAFVVAGVGFVAIATVALFNGDIGGRELIGANRITVARALLFVPLVGLPMFAWNGRRSMRWAVILVSALALFLAVATASRAAAIIVVLLGLLAVLVALLRARAPWRVFRLSASVLGATLAAFVLLAGLLPPGSPARFGLLVDGLGTFVTSIARPPTGPNGTASPDPGATPDADPTPTGGAPGDPGQPSDEPLGGSSVALRLTLYQAAWAMFLDHPLLGAGTGGFEALAQSMSDISVYDYPHNLPLHVAADFGLIGLAIVLSLAGLILPSWRPTTTTSVALGMLFAFLALSAMVSNSMYDNRLLWGVGLVVVARPWIANRRFVEADAPGPGASRL